MPRSNRFKIPCIWRPMDVRRQVQRVAHIMINRLNVFLLIVDPPLELCRQRFVANVHVVTARPVKVDELDLTVLIEQDILGP